MTFDFSRFTRHNYCLLLSCRHRGVIRFGGQNGGGGSV